MRRFAGPLIALAAVIAALGFPTARNARAADAQDTPVATVSGSGSATCELPGSEFNGQKVAAARQAEVIDLEIAGFADPDVVSIWITFPDGRAFDVVSATYLDGISDFVEDNQTKFLVNGAGGLGYGLSEKLPIGCHRITVESVFSGRKVIAPFVLNAGGSAASGPVSLAALPAQASQNDSITLEARGFDAKERVAFWITQPDGTVIDLGSVADTGGDFDLIDFVVPSAFAVGWHKITAYGTATKHTAITSIEVLAGRSEEPTGDATLDVAYDIKQRQFLFVDGYGFPGDGDGESVSIWLTYPNGKALFLADATTDAAGSFALSLPVDEQFPVGAYGLSARGNETGHVATAAFRVDYGDGPGEVDVLCKSGRVAAE